jgi:hypothetical protein
MKHPRPSGKSPLLTLLLMLILTSCSANEVSSYPSLANRGILPLSTTNAFLGANLFLAREVEKSSFLFNFFEKRGAPVAIEIRETKTRPLEMFLFYPKDHEVYIGHRQTAGNNFQWIVRGPYSITRKDFLDLKGMQLSFNGEPTFQIYGNPYRFRFQPKTQVARNVEPEIPVIPKPVKKKKKKAPVKPKKKEPLKPKLPEASTMSTAEWMKLSTDQKAILLSKGYADRTESGDVIHIVRGATESLKEVAKWYTGSDKNADILGKANAVLPEDVLQRGQRIIIPEGIARNFKAMPSK